MAIYYRQEVVYHQYQENNLTTVDFKLLVLFCKRILGNELPLHYYNIIHHYIADVKNELGYLLIYFFYLLGKENSLTPQVSQQISSLYLSMIIDICFLFENKKVVCLPQIKLVLCFSFYIIKILKKFLCTILFYSASSNLLLLNIKNLIIDCNLTLYCAVVSFSI